MDRECNKEPGEDKMVIQYPVSTEKAIRLIEMENKITFIVDRKARKKQIKDEVEKQFNVKTEKINVQIKGGKKIAIVKLKPETPAIDIAIKIGLI